MKKNSVSVRLLALLLLIALSPRSAQAEASFGNSALTVALSTVAGAVLGASTLPFYEDSGEHTKNIFYGAALGAVVGVLVSAYSGIKEGPNYDEEGLLRPTPESQLSINQASAFRLRAEASTARLQPASFANGSTLIWSPLAQFRF